VPSADVGATEVDADTDVGTTLDAADSDKELEDTSADGDADSEDCWARANGRHANQRRTMLGRFQVGSRSQLPSEVLIYMPLSSSFLEPQMTTVGII
jgi:hypothetical protein